MNETENETNGRLSAFVEYCLVNHSQETRLIFLVWKKFIHCHFQNLTRGFRAIESESGFSKSYVASIKLSLWQNNPFKVPERLLRVLWLKECWSSAPSESRWKPSKLNLNSDISRNQVEEERRFEPAEISFLSFHEINSWRNKVDLKIT